MKDRTILEDYIANLQNASNIIADVYTNIFNMPFSAEFEASADRYGAITDIGSELIQVVYTLDKLSKGVREVYYKELIKGLED